MAFVFVPIFVRISIIRTEIIAAAIKLIVRAGIIEPPSNCKLSTIPVNQRIQIKIFKVMFFKPKFLFNLIITIALITVGKENKAVKIIITGYISIGLITLPGTSNNNS